MLPIKDLSAWYRYLTCAGMNNLDTEPASTGYPKRRKCGCCDKPTQHTTPEVAARIAGSRKLGKRLSNSERWPDDKRLCDSPLQN